MAFLSQEHLKEEWGYGMRTGRLLSLSIPLGASQPVVQGAPISCEC